MRVNVFLSFVFITIGLCLWLIPTGTEAHPIQRNNFGRCPQMCANLYCPCGYDTNKCPQCSCRPSNTCTGRHPNAFGRPPSHKSHILY
jgi:hypothetical protein